MKTATTLAALAIQCVGQHSEQTAASCMAGTTWDAAKGTCVETPSS